MAARSGGRRPQSLGSEFPPLREEDERLVNNAELLLGTNLRHRHWQGQD